MIKVTCRVEERSDKVKESILINNHWNDKNKIEIEINGERHTFLGNELIEAIKNCMNTARYC